MGAFGQSYLNFALLMFFYLVSRFLELGLTKTKVVKQCKNALQFTQDWRTAG